MFNKILQLLQAIAWIVRHPFKELSLTVVRRYVDAQGHYIGELYEGDGRTARMIGASCDNWPLNADVAPLSMHPKICYRKSFLEPMPRNTLRVGAMEPQDNADVQAYIARRRFSPVTIMVLNRFVEHIMENKI